MTFNSSEYWESRYLYGGTSGDGSYGHLATFKARTINNIIKQYNISSVIDYGVGDGNQSNLIDTAGILYYGVDVSQTAINLCKDKCIDNKIFMTVEEFIGSSIKCELAISCDVIYHLVEEDVYHKYMQNLCNFSNGYVLIYAKNQDLNHTVHVKFRKFSNFMDSNNYKLIEYIANPYPQYVIGHDNKNTSPSDFYFYRLQ